MNKTIICSIPMVKKRTITYSSFDKSLPVSGRPVLYPINDFLGETLGIGDEIKAIILTKNSQADFSKENTQVFISELKDACKKKGATVESIKEINTDFSESKQIHEQLLLSIVEELRIGEHLIADITYGPKDMPIVVFTALNFAEQYLNCEIENIIYGQTDFNSNNQPVNAKICDMSPLYYLNSITNTISCSNSERAKELLRNMLII